MSWPIARSASIALVLAVTVSWAAAQDATAELTEFKSTEGGFRIDLPGEPQPNEIKVGKNRDTPQYQFLVGSEQGVYLVSYQDNSNLEGASTEALQAALVSGQEKLLETFSGELLESKPGLLDKQHPSLAFRITMPKASGEARCRFFLVGTRLYQVMAMGVPEFANSEEAKTVLASFKLLK